MADSEPTDLTQKVQTRAGYPAIILPIDDDDEYYPVRAAVYCDGEWFICEYTADGWHVGPDNPDNLDLINVPPVPEPTVTIPKALAEDLLRYMSRVDRYCAYADRVRDQLRAAIKEQSDD